MTCQAGRHLEPAVTTFDDTFKARILRGGTASRIAGLPHRPVSRVDSAAHRARPLHGAGTMRSQRPIQLDRRAQSPADSRPSPVAARTMCTRPAAQWCAHPRTAPGDPCATATSMRSMTAGHPRATESTTRQRDLHRSSGHLLSHALVGGSQLGWLSYSRREGTSYACEA
jgi:hypothetical protein